MDIQQNKIIISPNIINSMIDDLIEIKRDCSNKDKFRHELIVKRLRVMNSSTYDICKDIERSIKTVKENKDSEFQLGRALKQVFSALNEYQQQLVIVLNRLR